jgi:hypothetical protein
MSIFANKLGKSSKAVGLGATVELVAAKLADQAKTSKLKALAGASFGAESIDSRLAGEFETAVESFSAAIESIWGGRKVAPLSQAQRDAGLASAMMVGDIEGYLKQPTMRVVPASEGMSVVPAIGGDSFDKRTLAVESYDEKENRKAAQYTVAYNVQASRQDEFGETFFPTVTVTPDNVGFMVQARVVSVFDDFHRSTTGAVDDYKKKNIIRAAIDATILKNDLTRITPVYRAESAGVFVDSSIVAAAPKTVDGESINTAPLAVGKQIGLLGLSQTDTLLANGTMDPTDSIDPAVYLDNSYIKVGADVLKFPVRNLPLAAFNGAVQGNYRQMSLAFNSTTLPVMPSTVNAAGAALVTLAPVVSGSATMSLSVSVSGTLNAETGTVNVFASNLSVTQIVDSSGYAVDLTAAPWAAVVTAVGNGSVVGYDLYAFRTNLNRRQRGQLLDTTFFSQLYPVALRSPITVLRPVTHDGQSDASDLAALITATQIRASNEAVTALLEAATTLQAYVNQSPFNETLGVTPDILGVGRLLVVPAYAAQQLDMNLAVQSLTSADKAADIQATLVNVIRDLAYRLYRDSGYQPAANALAGGNAPAPTVIIGTDPVLARYLMVDGDLRTLGGELNCRVVSTNDSRMAGKIAVTFGQFEGGQENAPNPLHFGNMAWKPEMTLVLPVSRGGQTSKELTVQPSFRHIVNLPVLGLINVLNVPNIVASRIPVAFETVSATNGGVVSGSTTVGNVI